MRKTSKPVKKWLSHIAKKLSASITLTFGEEEVLEVWNSISSDASGARLSVSSKILCGMVTVAAIVVAVLAAVVVKVAVVAVVVVIVAVSISMVKIILLLL